jgi:hypothetical protein
LALIAWSLPAEAQCAMCKMAAESNLNRGGTAGRGLNSGILYMLATPYLLVGILGYLWWRNRHREDEPERAGDDNNK